MMEILNQAYKAFIFSNPEQEARMQSRLLDAALDAGMPYDEPCVDAWAAKALGGWLLT